MDKYRQEILDYLNDQDDSYFTGHGTTRQLVLADTERIDRLTAEHRQCVEKFGCDRRWSVQDACDKYPGIVPAENASLTFHEDVAQTARLMLRMASSRYETDIWNIIGPEVIADVQKIAGRSMGQYTNDDIRQAIGKAITKRLEAWACEV